MRRLITFALIAPYCVWFWPQWAAQDIAAAFMRGYRKSRPVPSSPSNDALIVMLRDPEIYEEPDPGWQDRVMSKIQEIEDKP